MKKILKFLLVPIFVATPAISVAACDSDSGISYDNRDVLTSAVGRLENKLFNFKLNEALGLTTNDMPNNNVSYESWAQNHSSARNTIVNYYKDLLSENNTNWPFETVSVDIKSNDTSDPDKHNVVSNFVTKYGSSVESRVNLTAHLTYKNLSADTQFTIKINNDESKESTKLTAIGGYLKDQIKADSFSVSFGTLLADELKNANSYDIAKIKSVLKDTFFKQGNANDPVDKNVAIVDVDGIDLNVATTEGKEDSVVYKLNDNAVDTDKGLISGVLENLTLKLFFSDSGISHEIRLDELDSQHLNITQNFTDASNQIRTLILRSSDETVSFERSTMPGENMRLEDYDASLSTEIKDKLFTLISETYPEAKMGSSWTADSIKINNPEAPFVVEDKIDEKIVNGYFSVNISFEPGSIESINVSNMRMWVRFSENEF